MAFNESRFLERTLIALVIISLVSFAYYFTISDLDEVENRYANRRVLLVKLLAREIVDMLNRRMDLTPRLSNLLSEEAVAYALVQQADGAVLAKAENFSIPVGVLESVEETAIKAVHLQLIPFNDTSRTIPMIEAAIPLITLTEKKVVLRVGFFRSAEEKNLNHVKFRNSLIFAILMLGLATYWYVRMHNTSNLQHTLLGGTALAILLLFLGTRMTIQNWYDQHWRQNFVRHGLYVAKMFAPPAVRFIETGEEKDLKEAYDLVSVDDDFSLISVIKDDQIIFHSDPTMVGQKIEIDQNYSRSLNYDHPIIFKLGLQDMHEAYVPLMKGTRRLGTLRAAFRNSSPYEPLYVLRNKIVFIFLGGLIILLFLMHLLSKRVSKEVSWFIKAMEKVTAGDLNQQIFIERNDELGQMAHAFNFMLMSMKERDMIGKGLQQYVSKSIVDRTLKALSDSDKNGEKVFTVSIFVYFSGIDDSIERIEGQRIFSFIQEAFETVRKICHHRREVSLQLLPSGILAVFHHSNKHDTLLNSLNAARMIAKDLGRKPDMPFSPKITLHAAEMVKGKITGEDGAFNLLGDGFIDFRTLSKIQDNDEVIASRDMHILLKDVFEFDELEVLSGDQGRLNAFVLKGFKSSEDMIANFAKYTSWTKVMVLRILKSTADISETERLFAWFEDKDPSVRYHVLEALERQKPNGLCEFLVKIIDEEKEPRVLSRAIRSLGKLGSEEHISCLTEKLRSNDRRVKANTVEALESIGGKRVYEFLNLLVDEQDNRVKANILIALGKYGDMKVFDLLSKMIKDLEPNMRASAAYALGRLGMAQGVEPLINALSDKDPVVRRQVAASLTSLKADLDIDF
jgi:HAMP domain-containing protein